MILHKGRKGKRMLFELEKISSVKGRLAELLTETRMETIFYKKLMVSKKAS